MTLKPRCAGCAAFGWTGPIKMKHSYDSLCKLGTTALSTTVEEAGQLGLKVPDAYRPGDQLFLVVAHATAVEIQAKRSPCPPGCVIDHDRTVVREPVPKPRPEKPPAWPRGPYGDKMGTPVDHGIPSDECRAGTCDCTGTAVGSACSGYCTGCHKEHGEIEAGS